jgi:hypothetical protein
MLKDEGLSFIQQGTIEILQVNEFLPESANSITETKVSSFRVDHKREEHGN